MAANDRDQYQGFLMMDARLRDPSTALWEARSTYTEASPRPGRCVPGRATEALLVASGSQADGTVLDILAVEGGPPGRDPRAAGLAWKNSGEGANAYRGREIPATLSAWEVVSWQTSTGITEPHLLTLRQDAYVDRVVIVAEETTAHGSDIVSWYRDTDGTLSSKVVIHDATDEGRGLFPCLVEAGDRLFCLHWSRGIGSASDSYFIRVQMSLDGGATWETVRRQATTLTTIKLSVTHGSLANRYEAGRLRAAHLDGQVLVMGHVQQQLATAATEAADLHIQWASSNLATKLERVEITTAADKTAGTSGGPMDVTTAAGAFVVTWAQPDGALYSARLGSAYQRLSAAGASSTGVLSGLVDLATSPDRINDADIATVTDDVGILWTYARRALTGDNSTGLLNVVYSDTNGDKWKEVGTSDDTPGSGTTSLWNAGRTGGGAHQTDHYLQNFAVAWQRGRAVMAHRWSADTGINDQSLALAYLGGYHDLTIAPFEYGATLAARHPWTRTRLPIERAQDAADWTATTSGVVSNALNSGGYEQLSSGDGASTGALSVKRTHTASGDPLMVATFAAKGSNSGASSTTDRAAFVFRVSDGANYGVELGVYLEPTAFGLYDRIAASQLSLTSTLANEVREWRLGIHATEDSSILRCRVWYRSWDTSEDRQWTFVGAYSLSDDGGAGGGSFDAHGCFTTGIPQADLDVYHGPHVTIGDRSNTTCLSGCAYTWDEWVTADDNPDHLSLTPMSSLPVYLSGGVSVAGVDGPAMASDSWSLAPTYEYPLSRIHPGQSRSVRERWRSVDDTAQVTIALPLDATLLATTDSHAGAPLYGIWLGGVNFRTAELYKVVGGSSVKVADIDMADAFGSVNYTRQGATLLPNNDLTLTMAGQELVGWDFRTVGGSPNVVRRVLGNRGGRWHTGTTAGPRVRVHLDKIDDTEPASGSGFFCARSGVVLIQIPQADTTAGWELVIPVQDTVDGFFEIGSLMVGPVWVSGQAPDWGRRLEQTLGTAYRRQQDGAIQATRPQPAGYGMEIAWAADINTTQFHSTDEPTHVTTTDTSGVEGAATLSGTVYDLQHEIAAYGSMPLVYLPKIPRSDGSGDVRTLTRWYEYLLCHVPRGLRVTHPLGEEGTDESLTVASVTLEPEL